MKVQDCPLCGKQPDTFGTKGLMVTGCLGAKHDANGIPGQSISDSKRRWNAWVTSYKNKKSKK